MKLKTKCGSTKVISQLYKLERSLILPVHQMKIQFMTAENSPIARPK